MNRASWNERTQRKRIGVFGLGWLGLPLAQALEQQGYSVWGTVTSTEKQGALAKYGIDTVVMQLPVVPTLPNCDLAVINIPPTKAGIKEGKFVSNILYLADTLKAAGCEEVIFISTTGVYGDYQGEVTELTPPQPNTASGKAHVTIEIELQTRFPKRATVLRLAGLIGTGRHPVRSLVKKTALTQGGRPVNLIVQDDAIAAIVAIVEGKGTGRLLHLASPEHPSRRTYYTQMAGRYELDAPHFIDDDGQEDKYINASLTFELLGLSPSSVIQKWI